MGARRPVPAAKAERPLCDQGDRTSPGLMEWTRCAEFGHSEELRLVAEVDRLSRDMVNPWHLSY